MKDATEVAKIQYAVLFIAVLGGLVKDRLMVLTAPTIRVIRKVMVIISSDSITICLSSTTLFHCGSEKIKLQLEMLQLYLGGIL